VRRLSSGGVLDRDADVAAQLDSGPCAVFEGESRARERPALEAHRFVRERALLVAPVLEPVGVELEAVVGAQPDVALESGSLAPRLVQALVGQDRQRRGTSLAHERQHRLDAPQAHGVAFLAHHLAGLDLHLPAVVLEAQERHVGDRGPGRDDGRRRGAGRSRGRGPQQAPDDREAHQQHEPDEPESRRFRGIVCHAVARSPT
jgi:hypothetical protein